jgi:hypothetical protein
MAIDLDFGEGTSLVSQYGNGTGFDFSGLAATVGDFLQSAPVGQAVEFLDQFQYGGGDPGIVATPAMASSIGPSSVSLIPAIGAAAKRFRLYIFGLLQKVAVAAGYSRVPSLKTVTKYIRGAAKSGLTPVVVATALGLTLSELADLMLADQRKKNRRMNPANAGAARRALRRLSAFDRMACRVQGQLKAYAGRTTRSRRCTSCRRSPCRCK